MGRQTHSAFTPSQQWRHWGVSAEADGDKVVLQVGDELAALDPRQARAFMYYVARAVFRAEAVEQAR